MSTLFSSHSRTSVALLAGPAGFAALLALAGCATSNSAAPKGAVTPPSTWLASQSSAPRDSAALAQWWNAMNDATLTALIEKGLVGNTDVRIALSRINAARAQLGIAQANLLPSVAASGSANASRTRDRSTDQVNHNQGVGASLDASWQVDLFGKLRASARASAADLAATEENFRLAQASLASEIATAYLTLRSNEAQLALTRDSLALQEDTVNVARWREQAGQTTPLDTQQAVSAFEQTKASLPDYERSISEARNQLAVLCGVTPGSLDTLLSGSSKPPTFSQTLALGIPAETLAQRPDVRAARQNVLAAEARVTVAQRDRLPSLSLTGSLGVNGTRFSDLTSPETVVSSLAGNLAAPLLDFGRLRKQVSVQNEAAQQALLAYESTVLTALSEVENALTALTLTHDAENSLTRAVEAAREASELAAQQYAAGEADLLVVLDAQRTYLSVQQKLLTTSVSHTRAGVQLYNALGGGWSTTL